MRDLRPFRRQRLIMKRGRSARIEREIELVAPAEFEARLGEGVVAVTRARMAFGEVRRDRLDFENPTV